MSTVSSSLIMTYQLIHNVQLSHQCLKKCLCQLYTRPGSHVVKMAEMDGICCEKNGAVPPTC